MNPMMYKLKVVAGALVLILILAGFVWVYIGQVQVERDLAVLQAQTLIHENLSLTIELDSNRKALELREAERTRLLAERQALEIKLGEIYERDPKSRAWADTPCPDGVLECLWK